MLVTVDLDSNSGLCTHDLARFVRSYWGLMTWKIFMHKAGTQANGFGISKIQGGPKAVSGGGLCKPMLFKPVSRKLTSRMAF